MKIIYVKPDTESTVFYYRCQQMMCYLSKRGHYCIPMPELKDKEGNLTEAHIQMIKDTLYNADFLWLVTPGGKDLLTFVAEYTKINIMDNKVAANMLANDITAGDFLKENKISDKPLRILIDYDDDIFSVLPDAADYVFRGRKEVKVKDNGEWKYLWKDGEMYKTILNGKDYTFDIERNKTRLRTQLELLKFADIVTSPSPKILDRLHRFAKNADGHYLPNAIDSHYFTPIPHSTDDKVRLIWAISTSHHQDWLELYPWIGEAMVKYPNLELHVMGTKFGVDESLIDTSRMYYIPWVQGVERYAWTISANIADIGIAHVSNNTFNKYKSPLKATEMITMGIPCLCSGNLYGNFIPADVARVYYNKEQFIKCIDDLMINRDLPVSAEEWIYDNYSLDKVGRYLENILVELSNKPLYQTADILNPKGEVIL